MDILLEISGHDIPTAIRNVLSTWDGEVCDINKGKCEDFADMVHAELGRPSDISILSTEVFDDPYAAREGDVWQNDINVSALDRYGSKIDIPNDTHIPGHVWIYYNKKHYDAEAPNGVNSLWELPIFKKSLK